MKKILGLVVILAVLILGSYYGTGMITERTLRKNVLTINQSNGLYVEIEKYNRGWFTSKANFTWRVTVPERVVKEENTTKTIPAQSYSLDMPLTVYHGPVIFADSKVKFGLGYGQTKLKLPQPYLTQFGNLFTAQSTQPEMDVSVLVNYLNRSRLRISVPQFTLIAKADKTLFEWKGFTNDVTISNNLDVIDGDFMIDGIHVKKDDASVQLGKVTSEYDLHKSTEGLYLGQASVDLPSLVVVEKEQKIFELQQWQAHSKSSIDDGLFNTHLEASLDTIVANGKSYGPGVLRMAFKNLDAQVLAEMNEKVNQMQQGSDMQKQQALIHLLPDFPKLLNKGATFEISEMRFVMPQGEVAGDLVVRLPKGDTGNPFQLIQKTQGEGHLQIPADVLHGIMKQSVKQKMLEQPNLQQAIAEQIQAGQQASNTQAQTSTEETQGNDPLTPQQLDKKAENEANEKLGALVKAGVLTRKDQSYVINLKLENGQLTVNGQPFSTDMIN